MKSFDYFSLSITVIPVVVRGGEFNVYLKLCVC